MAKILVVDDEKMIAIALQRVLVKSGHNVFTASNGIEAFSILERNACDLAILDLLMPEMNGSELLDLIRAKFPKTKAIIMTAYGEPTARDALMQRGAIRVLAKPFENILEIPNLVAGVLANA